MRSAVFEMTRQLDEVAADLSFAESQRVKPAFDSVMRDALSEMEQVARAFNAAAMLADQLRRRPSAVLLPDLSPEAVVQLGDPDAAGTSQAWRFKKALQERGIV